jgi:hypothetical protein
LIFLLFLKLIYAKSFHLEDNFPLQYDILSNYDFKFESSSVTHIKFMAFDQHFILQLTPYSDIFHPQANILIDGKQFRNNHFSSLQTFKGFVAQRNFTDAKSWARITTHMIDEDTTLFEGVFFWRDALYTIKSFSNFRASFPKASTQEIFASEIDLIIYRELESIQLFPNYRGNSIMGGEFGCETKHFVKNISRFVSDVLLKRDDVSFQMGMASPPSGCPQTLKYIYMGVAADCTYVSNYGGVESALKQIISNWNQASSIFEKSFNIALGIITIDLQSTCDTSGAKLWNRHCESKYAISDRLNDFSKWRGIQNADAGLWHLMSLCSSAPVVGLSWTSQVCLTEVITQQGDSVSGTGISTVAPNEWLIVAHGINTQKI